MNNKGFLLVDSLVSIFIVSNICLLCMSIFEIIDKYEEGYLEYIDKSNIRLETIMSQTIYCEGCYIDDGE